MKNKLISHILCCRIKCDVDSKEFEKMSSVQVMVERIEMKSSLNVTDIDEIEERKVVLGLKDKDSETSSTGCGESVVSSISEWSSVSMYTSDVSFIDDGEESCEDFLYPNPYCSENSSPSQRMFHCKGVKRKVIDSDDSIEGMNQKINPVMKKKKRVARIESDESSQSDIEIKKQVARIESDESSQSDIEIKKPVARIESDESSQSDTEIKKRVARIESDESSESEIEIEKVSFTD